MLERLEVLRQQRFLSDLDVHFARLMGRLAGGNRPELLLAAALVSRVTGSGSVCLNIPAYAGRPLVEPDGTGEPLLAPDTPAWLSALRASPVVD